MRLHTSLQSFAQLCQLGAESSAGQGGQNIPILLAIDHCLQHVASTFPQHVSGHHRQLDVGSFPQLLQAVDLLSAFLQQRLALARQVPQLADRFGRKKARLEQAMAQ
jgi:hypothetical protein